LTIYQSQYITAKSLYFWVTMELERLLLLAYWQGCRILLQAQLN